MPKPQTAPPARSALRHRILAVAATAATAVLLGGSVLAGTAAAAPGRGPKVPQPPAQMSTVGGDRLGVPGTQVDLRAAPRRCRPKLTARSWIVADAETGDDPRRAQRALAAAPASTLKMLFADTVLPKFPTTEHKVVAARPRGHGRRAAAWSG